jgi:hypothetical protein
MAGMDQPSSRVPPLSPLAERVNSKHITKDLIVHAGEWREFYIQTAEDTDKYARNRANIYRIYVKRHDYPIDVAALRHKDGLIHCWGRWNEGNDTSPPPTKTPISGP